MEQNSPGNTMTAWGLERETKMAEKRVIEFMNMERMLASHGDTSELLRVDTLLCF